MDANHSPLITKEDLKIFKGKYYLPWLSSSLSSSINKSYDSMENKESKTTVNYTTGKKVVVLDLDETIGSFTELYIMWCGIRHAMNTINVFNQLCELYPEFFRFGMITILEYLYAKKLQKECHQIFIYTNNQCPGKWVSLIGNYLDEKVRSSYKRKPRQPLFDKIIGAFRINNKPIELCRTSHSKKMDDFIRCTLVSEQADICFIDDVHYPAMKGAKVYYICPRPYIHHLSASRIIKRLVKEEWLPPGLLRCSSFWKDWFSVHQYKNKMSKKTNRKNKDEIMLDLQISHKMIYHLKEFMMFGKK
jgi:hypothetical protein